MISPVAIGSQNLVVRTEDGASHTCEVRAGVPFVVGRGKETDLRLDYKSVSRQHCQLELDAASGFIEIVDLGSQNGTRLNGKRVARAVVRTGDELLVATVPLRVTSAPEPPLDAPEPTPPPFPGIAASSAFPAPLAESERRLRAQLEDLGLEIIARVDLGSPVPVYHAHRPHLDQDVLVKAVLVDEIAGPGDRGARLLREAKLAAKVRHRNVVQIYDVREAPGLIAIIFEWAEGRTLAQEIQRAGRLPAARALDIAIELCHALEHAHALGVIHRNITPATIVVSRGGDVKLIDFGLAKSMTAAGKAMELTRSGQSLGAVEYAPPEQARDARDADHRSDIYSIGSTLYHALAGEPPLIVIDPQSLDDPYADVPAPIGDIAPDVPECVRLVIERAMRARRDDRYQSAAELRAALEEARSRIGPGRSDSSGMRTGFVGRIQTDELIALLQMIEHSRKSGFLEMDGAPDAGGRRILGAVVFRDGQIVEARSGEHRGVEALQELFLLPSGDFRVVFGEAPPAAEDQQLPLNISVTIMELLRRRDETAKRTKP